MQVGATGYETFTTLPDRANLNRADFTKILVLQLQTQNPLEPMDDEKMVNQLVQLQNMENNDNLAGSMQNFSRSFGLLQLQLEFTSAASFIGKSVRGEGLQGQDVEGEVVRISVEGGQGVVTWVDTGEGDPVALPFNNIIEVMQPAQEAQSGNPPAGDPPADPPPGGEGWGAGA